jgi:8-oxo-dGTP pyrophosphatase MutT (NUDIX family)
MAGILPTTIKDGKLYFLFGRDIGDTPGFADFGGGRDANETFYETALREGLEETTGFLGDIKPLIKEHYTIDYFPKPPHKQYRIYLFYYPYDDKLPIYFNNNRTYLTKKIKSELMSEIKIFEKAEIKWFCIDELKKNADKFRVYYKDIIDLILKDKRSIQQFIRRQTRTNKTRTNKRRTNKTKRYKA